MLIWRENLDLEFAFVQCATCTADGLDFVLVLHGYIHGDVVKANARKARQIIRTKQTAL